VDGSSLSDAGPAAAPRLPGGMSAGPWLVLAASVLWGTTGTSQALAPAAASSLAIGSLRLTLGAAVLLAFAAARGAVTRELIARAPGPLLGVAAGIAIYQLAFFSGVRLTGVAVGTLVGIGSSPIFAGLFSWIIDGERPSSRWHIATLVALAGCALLVLPDGDDAARRVHPGGIALTLLAGAAYAGLSLAGQRLGRRVPADAGMALAFAAGALALAPVLASQDLTWLADARAAAVVLHLGILATAVPYVLYVRALRSVPVSSAVTLTLAEPLTAAMLGLFLLGERLPPAGIAGLACLIAGLALLVTQRQDPGRHDARPSL
jgi:DME family drug/metabolite transporter